MPRFLIHVGPHKTGTTYLQLVFAAARQRLLDRGVLFPTTWSLSEAVPSHHRLFSNIRSGQIGLLRSQFDQIVGSGVEWVLISAEDINHLQVPELKSLRLLMGDNPATIIVYCRRWSELLPSLWQERVKHGDDETLPEFLAEHVGDPANSLIINVGRLIEKYATAFGKDNIRVVSYSNVCDANLDLAEHFFASFLPMQRGALDGLLPLRDPRPNRSWDPKEVEIVRALNSFHAESGAQPTAQLRDWYVARRATLDISGVTRAIARNMRSLRFSDAAPGLDRIQNEFTADHPGVVVEPALDGCLFESRTRDIPFVQSRYLADPSCYQEIKQLYDSFAGDLRGAAAATLGG